MRTRLLRTLFLFLLPVVVSRLPGQTLVIGNVVGSGGSPTGAAGGDLTGTYPTPTLDLTLAHAWTAIQTFSANGIGATPTNRALLSNTTAAAAGAQQYSPSVDFVGQGWKTNATAASQEVRWRAYVQPIQGSSAPSSRLFFSHSVNGGGFTDTVRFDPAGIFLDVNGRISLDNSNGIQFSAADMVYSTFGGNSHIFQNNVSVLLLSTATNCSSSAAPAVCAAAPAGSVVVAAAATTVVVNTTAVTANSQIFVMYDSSLGTKLSVTCNTTVPALYGVTARTAATSFTLTASAPITNPACFSYFIVN